jgi:hypothetical protein
MNIQTDTTGDSGELVTIMLTAATKWETAEVRKHILGLTALRYQRWQKRRGKWSVQDFKDWFAKGPKHLGDVTKREMGQSHREGFVQ